MRSSQLRNPEPAGARSSVAPLSLPGRASSAAAPPRRQRGWVGLVVLLVALAIVGYLARDALKRYGLLDGGAPVASKAAGPGERARAPGGVGTEALDLSRSSVTPAAALERARGVEDMVQKAADERAARIDRASP